MTNRHDIVAPWCVLPAQHWPERASCLGDPTSFASVAMLPSDGIVSPADDRTLAPGVYAVADASITVPACTLTAAQPAAHAATVATQPPCPAPPGP